MKIEFNFGKRVTVLPSTACERLDSATKNDIKVLFALANAGDDVTVEALADRLGLSQKQISNAISFWQKSGVLFAYDTAEAEPEKAEPEAVVEAEEKPRVLVKRSDEMPSYTTEEIAKVLARRKDTSYLLDECQQELGKMFSTHDLNIMVGMLDYLGVDMGYIVTLLKYCNRIGKKTMHYAEKLAFGFVEEGIDNVDALKIRIAELDVLRDNESAVRKIFGMDARALTSKEKKCISLWFGAFGYDIKIVERAYEITVENTGKASVSYAHKILERWNTEGIRTLEDVQHSIDARKAEMAKETEGSFDTDDLFEAALKRSYQDQ